MNLYVEYFYFKDEIRNKEVFESFDENNKLTCIENIIVVGEETNLNYLKNYYNNKHNKIKYVVSSERCTFQYMFDLSKQHKASDNVSCVSNNDIIFTEDFLQMKNKITDKDFYCISRKEKHKNFHYGTAKWSQDAWCWKGECKVKNCNFYFGVPEMIILFPITQWKQDIK